MRKAFVTGGSGHLGANLVRLLLESGWKVNCLVHKDSKALDDLEVEKTHGDLTSVSFLSNQMNGCDAVFHLAAYVAVENINLLQMKKINVDGTKNMCEAAINSNSSRFIHFSSIHAFEQQPIRQILNEDRPLVSGPNAAPYDKSKAISQKIIYEACKQGLNASIIHPTGVLGPYDYKPSRMGQVLRDIMKRKMLFNINAGYNWVDARDVAKSAIKCVDYGKTNQNYILAGEWASLPQIAKIVSNKLKIKTTYATFPLWAAYAGIPFSWIKSKITSERPSLTHGGLHALAIQPKIISDELAQKELGHSTRTLEQTINDTIDWTQNHVN